MNVWVDECSEFTEVEWIELIKRHRKKMNKSLVVLSGGQDSVTTFFIAQQTTEVVGAVHFLYGSQHSHSELTCANKLCNEEGIELHTVDLRRSLGYLSVSALTEFGGDTTKPHPLFEDLPASFVPCRNLIFLTNAAACAVKLEANQIWTGVCETDYSGYPDCRKQTIDALGTTINLGLGATPLEAFNEPIVEIVTPLMHLSKAETFKAADDLGKLDYILEHTHTGYSGSRAHRYEWGWGPPEGDQLDPASEIRAKGYQEFLRMKK